jgi:hypothetical protein
VINREPLTAPPFAIRPKPMNSDDFPRRVSAQVGVS